MVQQGDNEIACDELKKKYHSSCLPSWVGVLKVSFKITSMNILEAYAWMHPTTVVRTRHGSGIILLKYSLQLTLLRDNERTDQNI